MTESIILLLIAALGVWILLNYGRMRQEGQRRRATLIAYQTALGNLKADPTNADLKQRALALGRAYARLTREQKAVTIFDEMALSNDISAATAGAGRTLSAEDRLQALDTLRAKGLVSDAEYTQKRQKLIDEM